MTTHEITTEAALKELREMFPKSQIYINHTLSVSSSPRLTNSFSEYKLTIPEVEYRYGPPLVITTKTLDELMAQVRSRAKEK